MFKVQTNTRKSVYYKVMQNGVMKVAREGTDLLAEHKPEKIPSILEQVDHTPAIKKKKQYKKLLASRQAKFMKLVHEMKELGISLVINLQGRDGSGKTGTVTCVKDAVWNDERIISSIPMGKPSQDENDYHYLWRMDKYDHHPKKGQIRVRDRGWQERVLVEKVMKLTSELDLQKSYTELRHYEWGLDRHGVCLVKIWLDITKDEQGERFERREHEKPEKKTKDDDVAREHWDEYTVAANELFWRTGTVQLPQYIISSEDKKYCHIAVLEILIHELHKRIKRRKAELKRAEKLSKKD